MKIRMKNKIKNIAIIYIFLLSFVFYQVVKAETEVIKNFDVNINIQKDGSLIVTEKIVYDFGTNQRHGIFRDIPLTSVNGPELNIKVIEVKDELGNPYKYTTSITKNILKIKIGDPDIFVTGSKTYIITYQVYNAIRTFEDHDELYWNVTGNEWPVAIQNANASVILPGPFISNVKMDCFTGPYGSLQKNCTFNQDGPNVNYSITQPLNANEGLTIVLGLPLGYINKTYLSQPHKPSVVGILENYFKNNFKTLVFRIIISFFLILFLVYIYLRFIIVYLRQLSIWRTKPNPVIPKELKKEPIPVEYNPPDNLLPIDVGTILDRNVDPADISSVIIDLAVRGYLKIRYTAQQIPFWPDKKDFEFIKLKDGNDLVHPADKIIFELLFGYRDKVKLSDLKQQRASLQRDIERIRENTEQYLYYKGYFDQEAKNKLKRLKDYISAVIVILFLVLFIYPIFLLKLKDIPIFDLLVVVVFIAFIVLTLKQSNKLTPQGISALRKILGFREFLQLTEKDKLELLNAPELQPEMFEKFLPYAMVLGVEDKWIKKFEGIYNTLPKWYEDATVTSFNSYVLMRNINDLVSSFNKVFGIASASSSFSSGFGSGGFSGGGSGGGGGRSW
jgi:uncharacterized membrane protein